MAVILGDELTVIAIVFVAEQPLLVPVIVYVMLLAGDAVTLDSVTVFNPVLGDQA